MKKWIEVNHRFLNLARLKRIWKQYSEVAKQFKIPVNKQIEIQEWVRVKDRSRAEEILSTPDWEDSTLIWLKLRALVGSGARSDTIIYFFYHDIGTTFSIARNMFIDQKSVHEVMRIWEPVGYVRRFGQKRGYIISAVFRENLFNTMEVKHLPVWFNAGKVFTGLALVSGAVNRYFEHQDAYILSSHIRDILPMIREIWEITGLKLPGSVKYPGKEYVPVFLQSLYEVSQRLGQAGSVYKRETLENKITPTVNETRGNYMSFNEYTMYDAAYRALRRRYPAREGWDIVPQDTRSGYRPDFVVERKNSNGIIERIVAEVKAMCRITRKHVAQLNNYARNLSGKNVKIVAKYLIVPSGADIDDIVPGDIEVIYLRTFLCE